MLTLTTDLDESGILTITINLADRPMNVLTPELLVDLGECVEQVAADPAIKGAILTSAKSSFIAGADILDMVDAYTKGITVQAAYDDSQRVSRLYRRLETCGKPVVAAINGLALGGGFELCLACHHRVMALGERVAIGLPEVKIGLLPGGGGTQRVPRLIGITEGLRMLLDGRQIKADEALRLGLVHVAVEPAQLLTRAREWLAAGGDAVQPWDKKAFVLPGGAGNFTAATAAVARDTQRNLPAAPAILSCVYEGTLLPIDTGLRVESRHFAQLLAGSIARNLMRTLFVNKGRADKLARRPGGVEPKPVRTVGVLGAGMMGAGITHAAAIAGLEVVLLDTTTDKAEQGKAYSATLLQKDCAKGRRSASAVEEILGRIATTTRFEDLGPCDLVVEAVFETRALKADVTRRTEAVVRGDIVFASNTSTLPISGLAEASSRPEQFIGLHFFSPVDKMPLVEVIVGRQTSRDTLAHALDFVGQIRKTPIVVNDSRGFYTSRAFATFVHEGMRMLEEGVRPALIENASRMAGMPVGPLAVSDEVSIDLLWKVIRQSESDLGEAFVRPPGYQVVQHFVEDLKRLGRRAGAGFYDYPAGGRKRLWTGLSGLYAPAARQPTVEDVRLRILCIQALETVRCVEEGVVLEPADADLGSILGWGFPSWTGGTLSFIETVGLGPFVALCDRFSELHGERFAPTAELRRRAASGKIYIGLVGSGRDPVGAAPGTMPARAG
jgi:3-hydroxyacyl-CoA dehydrogenase / enoyl-CoA hydratase / 3-hydroxybutyryl-CoA epimerase